jgi:fused signal recognition particle receptor
MIGKLFKALQRSRSGIADTIRSVLGKRPSAEEVESIEDVLLQSDMGYDVVQDILKVVYASSGPDLMDAVRDTLIKKLPQDQSIEITKRPCAMLIMGVNGSGKTTSTAKLANLYKNMGLKVTLVAADTYRAAAVDQLKRWSERVDCRLICNEETSEPVSVIFDGLESARASKSDLTIIDTAGRLHTSKNLMKELEKMYRVIETRFSEFNIQSMITLDATMGQNSLAQAKEFQVDRKLDGAVLTKLDGTAKGGIIFPLYGMLDIPVKFIGIGEGLSDMEAFHREHYVDGLLGLE